MSQIHLYVSLSTEDALAHGETQSGNIRLPLTQAILAPLSPEERAELARSCNSRDEIHYTQRLSVRALSPEAIAEAVRERMAKATAEAAAKAERKRQIEALFAGPREERLAYDESQLPGARWSGYGSARDLVGYSSPEADQLAKEASAANEKDRVAHDGRLLDEPVEQHVVQREDGTWIVREDVAHKWWYGNNGHRSYPRAYARAEELADARNAEREAALKAEFDAVLRVALTGEQWERYEAGVLPTAERDLTVRVHLFHGVELPLYERIAKGDVEHDDSCDDGDQISFDVHDFAELSGATMSADEYAAAKRVRAAFADHPRLESIVWRLHTAECGDCDAKVERYGARVILRVNGHTYSREYAIG